MKMWLALFSPAIVLVVWALLTAVVSSTATLVGRLALAASLVVHGCAEWKLHRWRREQRRRGVSRGR